MSDKAVLRHAGICGVLGVLSGGQGEGSSGRRGPQVKLRHFAANCWQFLYCSWAAILHPESTSNCTDQESLSFRATIAAFSSYQTGRRGQIIPNWPRSSLNDRCPHTNCLCSSFGILWDLNEIIRGLMLLNCSLFLMLCSVVGVYWNNSSSWSFTV